MFIDHDTFATAAHETDERFAAHRGFAGVTVIRFDGRFIGEYQQPVGMFLIRTPGSVASTVTVPIDSTDDVAGALDRALEFHGINAR